MSRIRTIVIAAAGRGSRMKNLSSGRPKHLIPVAGKPFFGYLLKLVDQIGFDHVIVVVGYRADMMRAFLETQPYNITIVDQAEQVGDKYGTAAVVEAVEKEVKDEPFVFMNGDVLKTPNAIEALMEDDGFTRLVGTHHEDPTHYGVLDIDVDGMLQEIIEKPKAPICNVINLGIYSFQPSIFDIVKQLTPSERGEYEITDAINILAREGKVKVKQLQGEWVDFGKPEDIMAVEAFLIKQDLV